jgi:hypothetical protein
MKSKNQYVVPNATILFWTINDEVIESPEVLERHFHEIREFGFGGVAAFVRCTRYHWFDPVARQALVKIGKLCRQHAMQCWLGPDPRFVSRELIPLTGGVEVLLFGDRARADVFPHFGPVSRGRFSVRCNISPRHVHTLQEVAIEYEPRGIEKCYALRMDEGGRIPLEVRDVSAYAHLFYNAREHYLEAFGQLPQKFLEGDWKVLPFFRASTNHVDFSDRRQMTRYLSMLDLLKKEGVRADGLMWDEPGFTCTYGTLPYSPAIRGMYMKTRGKDIEQELWKLAVDSKDGSHSSVRNTYYRSVQRLLNDANSRFTGHIRKTWGEATVSGIHDTWHFESADMCDMNHGSLDLWEAAKSKTGGFVDLGGIDKLRDPHSPWNSNLGAMSAICASLGKMSPGKYAFNNLWTVGDDGGEGWQATVMDHCVNTMALFGTRWLAHCYGPVGTIGEEQSFLGSPPMPGYPNHSTWRFFPLWNRRLKAHLETVDQELPVSNVLVVFPIESLYGMGGPSADRAATLVFNLVMRMLDEHYHVDVLSVSCCEAGRWVGNDFVVGKARFRAVVAPFATAGDVKALRLSGRKSALLLDGSAGLEGMAELTRTIEFALGWLEGIDGLRPVTAPKGCWSTMTPVRGGTIVTLSPSRHGYRYRGDVSFNGKVVQLPGERSGLTPVLFPVSGEPRVLPSEVEFSISRPT